MTTKTGLDSIDHITINVSDLNAAVKWYQESFCCELISSTKNIALLKFHNTMLCLTFPSLEQPHLAFEKKGAASFGELRLRSDGRMSTYISDPTGNIVELLEMKK